MSLITQPDVEARLGRSMTASEVSSFAIINQATQLYVENIIGSSVEDASASTRYYDGALQHLPIDPCTNVTAVKYVDDDSTVEYTLDTTDYTVEPINRTLKTMIRHRAGKLPVGINNIAVTAKFSVYNDSNTLPIIKDAMISALVTEIQNAGNIKKESIEGYSVEYISSESRQALSQINMLFPRII